MNGTETPVIVVGVDGTPASRLALEFALREGAARGSTVEVVTVWRWAGPHEPLGGPATPHMAHERARRMQDEAVGEALAKVPTPPIVSRQVIHGDAAEILLRAGRRADYLVVGGAHKGLLKRAILGSVSEYCVRHATCPVVVIPVVRRERATASVAPAPDVAQAG